MWVSVLPNLCIDILQNEINLKFIPTPNFKSFSLFFLFLDV